MSYKSELKKYNDCTVSAILLPPPSCTVIASNIKCNSIRTTPPPPRPVSVEKSNFLDHSRKLYEDDVEFCFFIVFNLLMTQPPFQISSLSSS